MNRIATQPRAPRRQAGYTVLELVIVIVCIGILVALVAMLSRG